MGLFKYLYVHYVFPCVRIYIYTKGGNFDLIFFGFFFLLSFNLVKVQDQGTFVRISLVLNFFFFWRYWDIFLGFLVFFFLLSLYYRWEPSRLQELESFYKCFFFLRFRLLLFLLKKKGRKKKTFEHTSQQMKKCINIGQYVFKSY